MSTTHFSFFYLYTFLLFLSISYFVFLRFFYFTKYADYVTKVIINLSNYLLILYLFAFGFSLAISIAFHSASLTSEAFAWYIANQLDSERLKGTGINSNCLEGGKLTILDKQRIDTVDHPTGKTSIPNATIKGGGIQDSNNTVEPHSPFESKKSFVSGFSSESFSDLRQKAQHKLLSETNDRLQEVITKSNMEAGNEEIARAAVNHLCDSTTAVPGPGINLSNVDKGGVEGVLLTYTETNTDRSKTKWVCVHTQRMGDLYNRCDDRINTNPKFSLAERCVFRFGTHLTERNQTLCMLENKIAPFIPNVHLEKPIQVNGSEDSPASPTNSPHNPFG